MAQDNDSSIDRVSDQITFKDIAVRVFRDAGYRAEPASELADLADQAHRAYLDQFAGEAR